MTKNKPFRARLIAAAKDLLWERGFESTSPRDILDHSGAGQGSFYHHFASKKALAAAALSEMRDEELATMRAIFAAEKPPLERIADYLNSERWPLRGCRLARLANEGAMEDEALRQPVAAYLETVAGLLAATIRDAQARGELAGDVDAKVAASTLLAIIEGGFVLSRAHWDEGRMGEVIEGAIRYVESLRPAKKPA